MYLSGVLIYPRTYRTYREYPLAQQNTEQKNKRIWASCDTRGTHDVSPDGHSWIWVNSMHHCQEQPWNWYRVRTDIGRPISLKILNFAGVVVVVLVYMYYSSQDTSRLCLSGSYVLTYV